MNLSVLICWHFVAEVTLLLTKIKISCYNWMDRIIQASFGLLVVFENQKTNQLCLCLSYKQTLFFFFFLFITDKKNFRSKFNHYASSFLINWTPMVTYFVFTHFMFFVGFVSSSFVLFAFVGIFRFSWQRIKE